MNPDFKIKNAGLALDVKAISDDGTFEGYGSVFGVVDSYKDVVKPGAFKASLAQRGAAGIKLLWQHDSEQPIGVYDDIAEDSKGLWCKGRLLKDVSPKAAEAYGLLKAGALDGLSIGYREIRTEKDTERPGVVNLLELDLREVSLVTFAANTAARVETVKAGVLQVRSQADLERVLREAGLPRGAALKLAAGGWPALSQEEPEDQPDLGPFLARLKAATAELKKG